MKNKKEFSRVAEAVHLVQLDDEVLSALRALPEVLRRLPALDAGQMLSLTRAARRARRRTGDVAAAIAAGDLLATRRGRGPWRITTAAIDAWAENRVVAGVKP